MLRSLAGASCLALASSSTAFLSAPTFAIWRLAFLNAKPAWREADDAAEGCMENDMSAMLWGRLSGWA